MVHILWQTRLKGQSQDTQALQLPALPRHLVQFFGQGSDVYKRQECLFDANDSVILTSATLAVSKHLKYTAETYLLREDDYLSYITPSPFDYKTQSLIAIPTDNPDYSQINEAAYSEMVVHLSLIHI